jgi:hypothetical protein
MDLQGDYARQQLKIWAYLPVSFWSPILIEGETS